MALIAYWKTTVNSIEKLAEKETVYLVYTNNHMNNNKKLFKFINYNEYYKELVLEDSHGSITRFDICDNIASVLIKVKLFTTKSELERLLTLADAPPVLYTLRL